MKERDELKELFSRKLENFEAEVKPGLWDSISSKLPVQKAVFTPKGLSGLNKFLIGFGTIATVTVLIVYITQDEKNVKNTKAAVINKSERIDTNSTQRNMEKAINEQTIINTVSIVKSDERRSANYKDDRKVEIEEIDNGVDILVTEKTVVNDPNVIYSNSATNTEEIVAPPIEDISTQNSNNRLEELNTIQEKENIKEAKEAYYIGKLSNIFTPNNDGINDFLYIESTGLVDFSVVVLDSKTSKVVYSSQNVDFKWDGIGMNGEEVPNGQYVYFITARDVFGNPVNRYENLFITREH